MPGNNVTDGIGRLVLDRLNVVAPAVENLACNQQQADMDGCMVKVSRQALDEVLAAINDVVVMIATAQQDQNYAVSDEAVAAFCRANPHHHDLSVNEIRAALADHVVVPREPTDDILKAGYEAMFDDQYNGSQAVMIGAVWDAMISAAHPAKEG